ncbi:MAG: hypothetical protein K1X31_07905 [Gemmatimonadaceae bacterium]|nr:hypothetical protein [Gemmatimonadaceae bacterium]
MTAPALSSRTERLDTERAPRGARLASRVWSLTLVVAALSVAVLGLMLGLEYYRLPFAERPDSVLYEKFRPAGEYGLRYGIVGFALITFGVVTYTARKRLRALARLGKLKFWLEFHIFVCTVGPFLVTLHTSFLVGGLVSIAYWSMVVVAASGIFGRYVYVRIPKTAHGTFAGMAAVHAQRAELLDALEADLGTRAQALERIIAPSGPARTYGLLGAVVAATRFGAQRRAMMTRVKAVVASAGLEAKPRDRALRLVERQLELEQQITVMAPFQRLFRYWHILHLPLAIAMFLIVAVHVTVATLFGFGF